MQIIGFSLKKVLIERKNPIKGKLEIKSNINLDNIEKEDISASVKPTLRFDFTFSIKYEPSIADLEMSGAVIAVGEEEQFKEILKEWKKKKFDSNIKVGLFNFILSKCNIKAIQLEDELGLPLHIPFPKLGPAEAPQKEEKDKKDKPSPKYAG